MNVTASMEQTLKSAHKSDNGHDQAYKLESRLWVTDMNRHCAQNLLYVGSRDSFVMCSMILKQTAATFYSYDPCSSSVVTEESVPINRALRGRYFCIEKAKEAEVRCTYARVLP